MKDDNTLRNEDPFLYQVAREGKTERPFTGEYVHTKASGTYHCAVCGAPLFGSDTKFDSGTGWPSFTDPKIQDAVTLHTDESHGMVRTEVRCARYDAHLGHVFTDGPRVNNKVCDRYCINSVSLDFKKQ